MIILNFVQAVNLPRQDLQLISHIQIYIDSDDNKLKKKLYRKNLYNDNNFDIGLHINYTFVLIISHV